MKIQQLIYEDKTWHKQDIKTGFTPQLVLLFASKSALLDANCYESLKSLYQDTPVLGCSTAGEILGERVYDDAAVATAIQFDHSTISHASVTIDSAGESFDKGIELSMMLPQKDLKNVLIISDGQNVNGTTLIEGLKKHIDHDVVVTGGLAGDGSNFEETLVVANDHPKPGLIVAIGFYGSKLQIGYGSAGGWDSFGPNRKITKSEANVLYELDGKPALELYKTYLGEEADNLPSSALLFPLTIRDGSSADTGKVRTILAVNEADNSMTFAGDMPEGHIAQLMMANFENLVEGAEDSAKHAITEIIAKNEGEKLAILISCVGRKLVLGPKTEEEVEATKQMFDDRTTQIGFYSYGEISPQFGTGSCELHNQTMTITIISEG